MGFWDKFIKKKRVDKRGGSRRAATYVPDVNIEDESERSTYIGGFIGQIEQARHEVDLLTGEYSQVTETLSDAELIAGLPAELMSSIKDDAIALQAVEQERQTILTKKGRMSASQFRHVREIEGEIEEALAKIRDAEQYHKLVKKDLARLDAERGAYSYRHRELTTMLANYRGMAIICLVAAAVCFLLLVILQFGFEMTVKPGYFVAAAAAAVTITVLYVKYMDASKELDRVEKETGKLISLQNTVKIRYANNTSLLNYLCLKYGVHNSHELEVMWNAYQGEVEDRKRLSQLEASGDAHKEELEERLTQFHVKDPRHWIREPAALIDPRDMVEARHELNTRRQALRDQMDYNRGLEDDAKSKLADFITQYPEYKLEVSAALEKIQG